METLGWCIFGAVVLAPMVVAWAVLLNAFKED